MLEPCSMDSLVHQHSTKKLSPKIAHHFKVLCESKATLPIMQIDNVQFFKGLLQEEETQNQVAEASKKI